MNWDKPNYAKAKEATEQLRLSALAETGRRVEEFLTGQHRGRIEWPDPNLAIGTNRVKDDYLFAVWYRFDDWELVAEGSTIVEALDNATKYFRSKLDEDNQSSQS